MIILSNAFSLQMLDTSLVSNIKITPIAVQDVKELFCTSHVGFTPKPIDWSKDWAVQSCVGHQDTANVLSNILGSIVPCNRVSVHLNPKDILVVAQIVGGRLQEGATSLPQGVEMQFLVVEIVKDWEFCLESDSLGRSEVYSAKACTHTELIKKAYLYACSDDDVLRC